MTQRAWVGLFVLTGVGLVALGLTRDAWWTLLGGVSSLAAAAYRATEDEPTP